MDKICFRIEWKSERVTDDDSGDDKGDELSHVKSNESEED